MDSSVILLFPQYELEEQKRQEELQNVPEFVRVKDNLRRVHVS